jgi:hypothetical protein
MDQIGPEPAQVTPITVNVLNEAGESHLVAPMVVDYYGMPSSQQLLGDGSTNKARSPYGQDIHPSALLRYTRGCGLRPAILCAPIPGVVVTI